MRGIATVWNESRCIMNVATFTIKADVRRLAFCPLLNPSGPCIIRCTTSTLTYRALKLIFIYNYFIIVYKLRSINNKRYHVLFQSFSLYFKTTLSIVTNMIWSTTIQNISVLKKYVITAYFKGVIISVSPIILNDKCQIY